LNPYFLLDLGSNSRENKLSPAKKPLQPSSHIPDKIDTGTKWTFLNFTSVWQ
jgi:hypothetical protein